MKQTYSIYHMLGILLSPGDAEVNKTDTIPALMDLKVKEKHLTQNPMMILYYVR